LDTNTINPILLLASSCFFFFFFFFFFFLRYLRLSATSTLNSLTLFAVHRYAMLTKVGNQYDP